MEEADQLSLKTAKLIVEIALQTRCRQMKEREKSQYISCINERLQTIKETCDLIRQMRLSNPLDGSNEPNEGEQILQLNILMNRLCLCDIPNLPAPLNRGSVQSWVEQNAPEEIDHLERCLKIASNQEKHKEQVRRRDLFTNPQTRGKWLDYISRHLLPRCQSMRSIAQERFTKTRTQ